MGEDDVRAWEHSGLPATRLDDWLTDRVARRPAGRHARDTNGANDVHDFARRAIERSQGREVTISRRRRARAPCSYDCLLKLAAGDPLRRTLELELAPKATDRRLESARSG